MRLLNVIQRYPPAIGGAELWCQEMSRHLAAGGHDVRVATFDVDREEEYWKDPLAEDRRLAFGRFGFDAGVFIRRYRRSLPVYWIYHAIYKRILDHRLGIYFYGPHSAEMYGQLRHEVRWADVVLLHNLPHPHNLVAFALAKRLGKPTVTVPYFHPGHPFYERENLYRLLRETDAVITLTDFEAEHLRQHGVAPERMHTAGLGIHPEEYRPTDVAALRRVLAERHGLAENDRIVTFIGRKTPEKGVNDLIGAARALASEMPLRLFLVGPRFSWFDEMYASLGEAERRRIIDTGPLSHADKVDLLHLSDLLVLPSRHESFGGVFLEAWMCGAAVVGIDEGAVPSVIDGGGYLARFGDPKGLADTIRTALAEREHGRELAARGRERVLERYTWDVVGNGVERRIREVARARGHRRRVVVCSNAYPPSSIGGAEINAHACAKQLLAAGYDVRAFVGEPAPGRTRYSLRHEVHEGIPVCRVALHDEDYSWEFFNFVHRPVEEAFERYLDETSPEVVHFHNPAGLSVGLLDAARRRRCKVVLTLHDYWGFCFKNTLLKRPDSVCEDIRRCADCQPFLSASPWTAVPIRLRKDYVALALESVDVFLAPGIHIADRYVAAGVPASRVRQVLYGIDLAPLAAVSRREESQAVRFVFVGNLGRHKGVEVLLEALAKVRGHSQLELVGTGDDRGLFERRVRDLGLADRVRFRGSVAQGEMAGVLASSDVLVLPSIWPETAGLCIMEAMASGIPVIASAIGGIPDLVDDGQTGYLVPAGDADALARRMSDLIDDRALLAELGARARSESARFAVTRQAAAIVAAYEENVARREALPAWIVACAGKRFDPVCARAVEQLPREGEGAARVVLADWLPDARLADAGVLWVVDPQCGPADVARGLAHRLPLLVPEASASLRDLVVGAGCGLYYADASDAVACLERLRGDAPLRAGMARNAFRLVHADRRFQRETGAID